MSLEEKVPDKSLKDVDDYLEEQKKKEEKKDDGLGMSYDGQIGMKLPGVPLIMTSDGQVKMGYKI